MKRTSLTEIEWHVGHTLRRVRQKMGLTQAQLVERAGVPTSQIQGLEDKGEARLATLSAVCKALGTTVHAITAYTAEIDRIRDIDDEAERRRG